MILRLSTPGILPLAIYWVTFGINASPAAAQATYNFSTNYAITSNSLSFATPDILEGLATFASLNAPFGLTKAESYRYIKIVDFNTGDIISTSAPNSLGLTGKPEGFFNLLGSDEDKLFGTLDLTGSGYGTANLSFSGLISIIGGEGRFKRASGTLFLSALIVDLATSVPPVTRISLTGSFKVPTPIPEPSPLIALFGLGMSGVVVRLSQRFLN
ncbi:MAG: hypothetical protein RLZZ143_765 [Cyanobacteriota bacterium]|jgi:hypothetical protein|uniref:hypothetical protein n=1 Tax=Microcystis aeruginosa TaxID=1126 RepID=UPI00232D0906|nr:hypothetical protein [Microcystis aeruginosa]MDB9391984.1 hypothetical protein [Microcystis aeruginosa CS-579]